MDLFEIEAREKLFFMHIPKTAGMSMRLYLREQYQARDICPWLRWHDLLGREDQLPSFGLVQGHFRYNLRMLLEAETRVLVMLREPLRRTVSALLHLQRDPEFHLDHQAAQGLSLPEMIRNPRLMRNQHNVQARYLCASASRDAVSTYLRRALPDNPNADAGDFEDPPAFELAARRLDGIEFVGLTEDIGPVVQLMARTMNFHPALYFPAINENPERGDPLSGLTAEDVAILRDYNDLDLEIYQYAKRLIERRAFDRDMRQLVESGVYQVMSGSFEIPISGVMPGSGWYEPDEEDGATWRWTGPGAHFTIEVPLRDDASYRLVLLFGGEAPPGADDLSAEVNDVPVAFEPSEPGRPSRRSVMIDRALLAPSGGFCRIRFRTREPVQMSASDVRALGVCVREIRFECLNA